jgi:two-component system, NarL family, nitrate/nitrite response regulator NarL
MMSASTVKPIRVAIVDDHTILRAGLRLLIEAKPDLLVVGEAANREEAFSLVAREKPDIILLDLDLGGDSSLSFMQDLIGISGGARVLVLTGVVDPKDHQRAVRLGARGLVFKEKCVQDLIDAIKQINDGGVWFDPSIIGGLVAEVQRGHDPESEKIAAITSREREIVNLVCEGLKNKEIAGRLSISEATVRNHLTSVLNKLGLSDRFELALYFYRHGLARPPG